MSGDCLRDHWRYLFVRRPFAAVVIAAILLGAYLLVSGLFQVVFAFSLHVFRRTHPAVHQRCGIH